MPSIRFTSVPPVDVTQACLQKLNHPDLGGIEATVLRLDRIDPEISGNKWFKLEQYIEQVFAEKKEGIVTFGGAYSNHLLAVAACCEKLSLKSVGIIRGEQPEKPGPTLTDLQQKGMELHFIPRSDYSEKGKQEALYKKQFPALLLVPEGGAGERGMSGAASIADLFQQEPFTHVVCAIGTGTMAAGLLRRLNAEQTLIGIPVLKITDPNKYEVTHLLHAQQGAAKFELFFDYHFNGYAKTSEVLFQFMNDLHEKSGIPTDFVYTGKLFYGFFDLVAKEYFDSDAKILIVHSGGLQGNRSLPIGTILNT